MAPQLRILVAVLSLALFSTSADAPPPDDDLFTGDPVIADAWTNYKDRTQGLNEGGDHSNVHRNKERETLEINGVSAESGNPGGGVSREYRYTKLPRGNKLLQTRRDLPGDHSNTPKYKSPEDDRTSAVKIIGYDPVPYSPSPLKAHTWVQSYLTTVFNPDAVVAKDGSAKFSKVQDAIEYLVEAQKAKGRHPAVLLYIKAGTYYEKVMVPQQLKHLTIVGDADRTKITYDAYASRKGTNGEALGTGQTGSLTVEADDFTMVNMIVENSSPRPQAGVVGGQAVAFKSEGNRTLVYNSSFFSFQDTLYAQVNHQYYVDCFIYGSVDFVFGWSKTILQNCTLFMDSTGYAGIVANHRMQPDDDQCFVIMGSYITGRQNQGWLGRAWGRYACTMYAWSYMDAFIDPQGWSDFGSAARKWSSFFAEFGNWGIGASLDGRVWWQKTLSQDQIDYFLTMDWVGLRDWMKPLPIPPSSTQQFSSNMWSMVTAPTACNSTPGMSRVNRNQVCFGCCGSKWRTSKGTYRDCMRSCRGVTAKKSKQTGDKK